MKILMISMFAPHFYNWTEQLKNSDHEVFWIDVFDSNTYIEKIDFVHQIIGWRTRSNYPGRYWVKENIPWLNNFINIFNQRNFAAFVDEKIKEIQPHVVQSFVLQSAGYPLRKIIQKYPEIKWIYSAWGSDLFYRQQNEKDLRKIKKVLPQFDYMFADCERDYFIAREHGFQGKFLGVFPTGGGYELSKYEEWIIPIELKKSVIIKGYEGNLGRCNKILEAIIPLRSQLSTFDINIFGANEKVLSFVARTSLKDWTNLKVYGSIQHHKVLELMGQSLIYIGNSISDGMPNTLLEAVIMEAFPIQSNPGGATAEIINNGMNGFLISNPESSVEIRDLLIKALNRPAQIEAGIKYNRKQIKPHLEREYIKEQVVAQYKLVEEGL